jgi:hypothetical protein
MSVTAACSKWIICWVYSVNAYALVAWESKCGIMTLISTVSDSNLLLFWVPYNRLCMAHNMAEGNEIEKCGGIVTLYTLQTRTGSILLVFLSDWAICAQNYMVFCTLFIIWYPKKPIIHWNVCDTRYIFMPFCYWTFDCQRYHRTAYWKCQGFIIKAVAYKSPQFFLQIAFEWEKYLAHSISLCVDISHWCCLLTGTDHQWADLFSLSGTQSLSSQYMA